MTYTLIDYSVNLKKIGEIMKSDRHDKAEAILETLSRGLIKSQALKKELVSRIRRSINRDGALCLYKLFLYTHFPFCVCKADDKDNFYLPGDESIAGIFHDEKWSSLAKKELQRDEMKCTIFNIYEAEFSEAKKASTIVYEHLRRVGCRYLFEVDGTPIEKAKDRTLSDFGVLFDREPFVGLDKIKDFESFRRAVENEWNEKSKDMGISPAEKKKKIELALQLVKNAIKHGEDAIVEDLG